MRSRVASPPELLLLSTPAVCVDGVADTVVVAVVVVVETTAATMVGSIGSKVVRDVGSSMVTRFCVFGVGSVLLAMMAPAPLRLPLMVGGPGPGPVAGAGPGGGCMLSSNGLGTKSTYGLCCSGT